ncbi:hypothetical protein HRbin15_00346 [bacterium HR15]|nr:hypothetical protein HRbin15_00346 [bacterium HR15]
MRAQRSVRQGRPSGMQGLWVLALSALALSAFADGRNYDPRVAPINAGVITFGANDPEVRDIYTFYALDQRTDLKPAGLSFQNPLAPAGMGRDQAAYWLVDLSKVSDAQLSRYRVLLLSRSNLSGMTIEMREKLRRFIDGGGVLWVDMPASGSNGTLFFPNLTFSTGVGAINFVNLNHPLLRGYYTLTPADIARLGARGRGFGGGTVEVREPMLQPVAGVNASQPVIVAGQYGAGRIVVSAAGVAAAINAPMVRSDGTPPPRVRTFRLEAVPALELKFAYNLLRWASNSTSDALNLRRSNAVPERYGAPLAVAWKDENTSFSRRDGGAVVYGGLVVISANGKLICYDANPNRDLDGDGRTDDGIPDLERGERFDKVWEINIGGNMSPPVIVETKKGVQVIVSTGSEVAGYWLLPRDPSTGIILPSGQRVWQVNAPTSANTPTLPNHPVPAPIAIENMLIVPATLVVSSRPSAGFYALDLGDGTNPQYIVTDLANVVNPQWYQPRTSTVGDWLLPPVAGYVPNRAQGGGSDLMIYFGTRRDLSGQGTQMMDGVQAFWLGAKGEQLIPQRNPDGTPNGYLHCRITNQARIYNPGEPNSPLRPRVYEVNTQTGVVTEITDLCSFNSGSQGRVFFSGVADGRTYYIDYFIDWATANNLNTMMRSFLNLPAMSSQATLPPNQLVGFTLGSNGILYIATGTESDEPNVANGNLIAVQEQWASSGTRSGGSVILWRWQSHGGYSQRVPNQSDTAIPAATIWNEPNPVLSGFLSRILDFSPGDPPLLNRPPLWMNFRFIEAPVYANGVIYALGRGQVSIAGFNVLYLVVLAFDAEPEQFVIDLGAPITQDNPIVLTQRDYARSGPNPMMNVQTSITYSPENPDPLIKVDYTSGQIRLNGFRQSQAGGSLDLLSALSISQPVLVTIGSYNALIDPDRDPANPAGKLYTGNWDNLLWYAVLILQEAQGPPVVAGDILYLPTKVALPSQFPGQRRTASGVLGLTTDPRRYQPNLAVRHAQAGTIPFPNLGYGSVIRWPFVDDLVNDLDISRNPFAFLREFFTRFIQSLPYDGDLAPLALGDGLLVVSAGEGLHIYNRQMTIIADEGRLVEVDTSSQVVWSSENTQLEFASGSFVPAFAKYPLTPNARVYRYGENQFLIVEPERNRVVILDRAGEEVRTLTGFLPDLVPLRDSEGRVTGVINLRDPTYEQQQGLLGSNYVSGMPAMLRNPTDVTVWTEFVPKARNPFAIRNDWEYWIHYTIADTGNNRVVDIVDRFAVDSNTFAVGEPVWHPLLNLPMTGVLYWMTPTVKEGQGYRYVGAQRFEYWDGRMTRIGFVTLVQNASARGDNPATEPTTPEAGMIILQVADLSGGRAVDRTLYIRKMRLPDGTEAPILAPVSVDTSKRSLVGNATGLFLLVTTSTGIYELQVPLTGTIGDTLPVTWMFTNEAYSLGVRRRLKSMRLQTVDGDPSSPPLQPILFKPRQARYLFNGNVLIVNGYSGSTIVVDERGNEQLLDFPGEVLELKADDFNPNDSDPTDGSLLGFRYNSILWSTADRPEMSGSYPLRKPSSADRAF